MRIGHKLLFGVDAGRVVLYVMKGKYFSEKRSCINLELFGHLFIMSFLVYKDIIDIRLSLR